MAPLYEQVAEGRRLLKWVIWIGTGIPGSICLITLTIVMSVTLGSESQSGAEIWLMIAAVTLFFTLLGAFAGWGMLRRKKMALGIWTGLGTIVGLFFTISSFSMDNGIMLFAMGIGLITLIVSLFPSLHPAVKAYFKTKPGDEAAHLLNEIGKPEP